VEERDMREIKFRVYSKSLYVMYSPDDNIKEPNLWDLRRYVIGGELKDNKDILMQYTGLKDKNGKEIYEGDIVRWNIQYCGKVYFKNAEFVVDEIESLIKNRMGGSYINANLRKIKNSYNNIEIIGNIYENPELLEV